jgi:hypothetical protein
MAGKSRVVAKDGVLHNGLARAHRFEEVPEMGAEIVVIVAVDCNALGSRFAARLRVVLFMPLLYLGCSHRAGKSAGVIAR